MKRLSRARGMTNRELAEIVKDQKPLILLADRSVREACRRMWEERSGSVLVIDGKQHLRGIFTGRDVVRLLAKGKDANCPLVKAMTRDPVTFTANNRAVDALRSMADGGFRHVPVTDDGTIKGVVSRGDLKGMEFEEFHWQDGVLPIGTGGTIRSLLEMLEGRKPLVLGEDQSVRQACRCMRRRKCGCTLVVDSHQRLSGIFTGRDAVRVLATVEDVTAAELNEAATKNPATLTPQDSAIDALRTMNDGGFRHLPIVDKGKILGVISRSDFTGIEIDRLDDEEHLKEVLW